MTERDCWELTAKGHGLTLQRKERMVEDAD